MRDISYKAHFGVKKRDIGPDNPCFWDFNLRLLIGWRGPTPSAIHHGGAGTTHLAIKYGCATMIIPHMIDQFVWDKIIFNMGVGPKGVKISRITNKNLELKVLELFNIRDGENL
jgi:hypothetical protein